MYKEKQEQEVMHERYEQQRLQNYRIASLKAQQRAEVSGSVAHAVVAHNYY